MGHGASAEAPPVVGDAPPPPVPTTRAADAFYDPVAMARAERRMRREHGGMAMHQVILNIAEVQVRNGRDGYRWDGEGWFGGDIHRLVVKSEGEGDFGRRVDAAEVQALYARAVDPYWNLQAGVRQDVGAGARRTYAVLGVEGLAPYWFDVEGALFLSDRGDARQSWEVTQVNEMLTWMDSHPLPFVAATNFARRLDPAALRRFVFKLELEALSAQSAAQAFERFFDQAAPAGLAEIGGLTPGDFAVVQRQLRYRPEAAAAQIVALLAAEAKAKPEQFAKIGF